MRRSIAVVLSALVATLISPLTLYFTRCVLFNHLLRADEIARQIDTEPLGFLFALVIIFVAVARWFYKLAIKEHWAVPVFRFAGVVLLAGVAGVFAVIGLSTSSSPSPEDSLQEARAAYMRRDLASFKTYVDVHAILSDGMDQATSSASEAVGGGILGAAVAITAASGKQVYLPELSQQVEQFVVTGSVPNQSESDAFKIALGSNFLRTLATSQLTYGGISDTRKISDDLALVTVRVQSSLSSRPVLVTFKLRSTGNHWQIVSIQNLAGLLTQLSDSTATDDLKVQLVPTEQMQTAQDQQATPERIIKFHYEPEKPAPPATPPARVKVVMDVVHLPDDFHPLQPLPAQPATLPPSQAKPEPAQTPPPK
jgi:hypothetical protein